MADSILYGPQLITKTKTAQKWSRDHSRLGPKPEDDNTADDLGDL